MKYEEIYFLLLWRVKRKNLQWQLVKLAKHFEGLELLVII